MASKENTRVIDSIGFVLTKADGTIIIGNTEIKPLTNDLMKKVIENESRRSNSEI